MTTDSLPRSQTPAWATPAGAALVVLLLLVPRVVFAARFGLIGDEAYYAIWSFHPAFNYFDRSLLGLALPQIKAEMRLSDTVMGLVSGLAFVLFYSITSVPIAWAADRWNRRNIVSIGFAFSSLMTLLTGWVANVWQLALTRFLMGAGEACGCTLGESGSFAPDGVRSWTSSAPPERASSTPSDATAPCSTATW